MEFKDKANLRFGVKTAVKAVPHLFSRSKNQYLNVSFKGDQGRATELVFELSPESVGKVTPTLEARTGKIIRLAQEIDPEVIGGLVLRIDGDVIDGTVRHQLDQLRRRLMETKVVGAREALAP